MSFEHTITQKVASGTFSLSREIVLSAGAENNLSEQIPLNSTDLAVAFALDVTQIKSLYIVSDKAVTIKTNSVETPGNTITLAAAVPVLWYYGCGLACPLTVDVTALYVTCTTAAALEIRALVDPTV